MLSVTRAILDCVEQKQLPKGLSEIFGDTFDADSGQFNLQENVVLDFKESTPQDGQPDYKEYVAGLVKLIVSLHNTYGGIIVFGVKDRVFTTTGVVTTLDVEHFNDLIKEYFGITAEILKRDYTIKVNDEEKRICIALIPKRSELQPAKLKRKYESYNEGSVFFRERHQAIAASSENLPFLFGERDLLSDLEDSASDFKISAYLPPSPATLIEFVARHKLSLQMWEWFVQKRSPRLYLCGTGGSGKSTLAYEFCRSVAENASKILTPSGKKYDYIIYLSAKETELNVITGKEQSFELQDFGNAEELYARILSATGLLSPTEAQELTRDEKLREVEEVFNEYNGLIVIDDIDALIRAGEDTGEEDLFFLATKSSADTKIIYTLRDTPTYAVRNSLKIAGLDEHSEFPKFVDLCCSQFLVPPPEARHELRIKEASSFLPLLIETIIGLRKSSSDYDGAIRDFESRGGEAARKYLYQREYDRIPSSNKGKQILAVMSEYAGPLGFDQIATISNISTEQCRDAIQEVVQIFIKITQGPEGDTLYELHPASITFLRSVSRQLNYFSVIKRSVEGFRSRIKRMPYDEAVVIQRLGQLDSAGDYESMLHIIDSFDSSASIHVNPNFRHLHGNALYRGSAGDGARARELYKSAFDYGYVDPDMMRHWFHLEYNSGYRYEYAIDVCQKVLATRTKDSIRSEFTAKIASAYLKEAKRLFGTSPDRSVASFSAAISAYLSAYTIGKRAERTDFAKTLDWLERAVSEAYNYLGADYIRLLQSVCNSDFGEIELDQNCIESLVAPLIPASRSRKRDLLSKLRGLLGQSLRPGKAIGRSSYQVLKERLDGLSKEIDLQLMTLTR